MGRHFIGLCAIVLAVQLGGAGVAGARAHARDPDDLMDPGGAEVAPIPRAPRAIDPDALIAPRGMALFTRPQAPTIAPSDPDGLMEPADVLRARRHKRGLR